MGFYSARVALESSAVKPEDVINTPDNIGNELEEIEKAIAGPDGLEADREEVVDAQTGLIGDPVDEAFLAIYESDYNFNQIMHTIGIHELSAASRGGELIMEAADIKGFFERIGTWLKKMFASIVKAFKQVMAKIGAQISNDKKFVEKHEAQIKAGFMAGNWTAKGFKYASDMAYKAQDALDFAAKVRNNLQTIESNGSFDDLEGKTAEEKAKILKAHNIDAGSNPDVTDVRDAIYKKLRGEEVELTKSNVDVNADIINVLKSDDDRKKMKESYDSIKASFDKQLKAINEIKSKVEKSENTSKAMEVCVFYTRMLQFQQNVENAVYRIYLDCNRKKRTQARALAAKLIAYAPKEKKQEVQHNSANLFDRMNLI